MSDLASLATLLVSVMAQNVCFVSYDDVNLSDFQINDHIEHNLKGFVCISRIGN